MTEQKKLLVVQFRTEPARSHEQQCFSEDLKAFSIEPVFVDARTEPLPSIQKNIAGVILCGSGDLFLSKGDGEDSWRGALFHLMDEALAAEIPLLGICFGCQLLALHQGAHIERVERMKETGTFAVTRTAASDTDPLFRDLPRTFDAHLAHQDTPTDLPQHLLPLAGTSIVVCDAFRVGKKPAWGVLFHPEFTLERILYRMKHAASPGYMDVSGDVDDSVKKHFHDAPDARRVLANFISFL